MYAAEQAGDPAAIAQARLKLGREQASLRRFCAENDLVRRYDLERAYGIGKQPRGLTSQAKTQRSIRQYTVEALKGARSKSSNSPFMKATSIDELGEILEKRYGVALVSVNELDFGSVRHVVAGIDEVLSDHGKAAKFLGEVRGAVLGEGTIAITSEYGTVMMNSRIFSDAVKGAKAVGNHEAGHVLELALLHGKGDFTKRYEDGLEAKSVLTAALKAMNADRDSKTTIRAEVDRVSVYPAREQIATGKTGVYYSEALACIVEKAYNSDIDANSFTAYVITELSRRLG